MLSQQLLDPEHLLDLTGQPMTSLRDIRTSCEQAEAAISFTRRVLHARIDIVEHELARRRSGARSQGVDDLVDQLPTILAESRRPGQPRSVRLVPAVAPGCVHEDLVADIDRLAPPDVIAGLGELGMEDVEAILRGLRALEAQLSGARRGLHERIDALQDEIVGRYERGEVDLDSLMS